MKENIDMSNENAKDSKSYSVQAPILLTIEEAMEYSRMGRALTKLIYDPTLDIGRFNGNKKLVYKKGLDKYIEQNRRLIWILIDNNYSDMYNQNCRKGSALHKEKGSADNG